MFHIVKSNTQKSHSQTYTLKSKTTLHDPVRLLLQDKQWLHLEHSYIKGRIYSTSSSFGEKWQEKESLAPFSCWRSKARRTSSVRRRTARAMERAAPPSSNTSFHCSWRCCYGDACMHRTYRSKHSPMTPISQVAAATRRDADMVPRSAPSRTRAEHVVEHPSSCRQGRHGQHPSTAWWIAYNVFVF